MTSESPAPGAEALLTMARSLVASGSARKAAILLEQALARHPRPEFLWMLRRIHSEAIPKCHFEMLHDTARNRAYQEALERAIRPGMTVLEIGTGSGLLAMMAARAGAASVITCEMDWRLAETARAIVAANGFEKIVTVVDRHSTELEIGRDLPGRADVLVAEVFGHMLLNEAALPVFAHARRHLLKPDAAIIPAAASFEVALAFDSSPARGPVGPVCGFDLSGMNRHRPISYSIPAGDEALALRSADQSLFAFDLESAADPQPEERDFTLVSSGGPVNGVVGWIRLRMDGSGVHDTRPGPGAASSWKLPFWPMPGLETAPGEAVTFRAGHNRQTIRIGGTDGTPWDGW